MLKCILKSNNTWRLSYMLPPIELSDPSYALYRACLEIQTSEAKFRKSLIFQLGRLLKTVPLSVKNTENLTDEMINLTLEKLNNPDKKFQGRLQLYIDLQKTTAFEGL